MTSNLIFILPLVALAVALILAIHKVAAKDRADRLRLDTLQKNHWQVGCIDGQFGVLVGSPPKMIGGGLNKDLRAAIDVAVAESVVLREF